MATPFPFTAGQILTAAQMNSITELPTRTLTASGAAVAADAYSRVILNGTSITFTINTSTFAAGQVVEIYNAASTVATIAAGAGVTLNGADSLLLRQYQTAELYAVSATSFILWKSDAFSQSKLIASTRDLTAASGNVAYTGAGFKPRALVAFGAVNFSIASFGMADVGLTNRAVHSTGGGPNFYFSTALILFETVSNNYQTAQINSYDTDGFTLAWTKTNTPTGTANFSVLCLA